MLRVRLLPFCCPYCVAVVLLSVVFLCSYSTKCRDSDSLLFLVAGFVDSDVDLDVHVDVAITT